MNINDYIDSMLGSPKNPKTNTKILDEVMLAIHNHIEKCPVCHGTGKISGTNLECYCVECL